MKSSTLRPRNLSVQEIVVHMNDGRLSSEALVRDCLEQIRDRDSQVKAWTYLDDELAIRSAREFDRIPAFFCDRYRFVRRPSSAMRVTNG